MQTLVTAAFTSAVPKEAPGEIVYIPVGASEITPSVNGKAKKITVIVSPEKGAAIAASLQSSLEKRLSDPVQPRMAFDHNAAGPASGKPKSFRFDPSLGIILALDWSTSGKAAVEGGDYSYFSPSFLIDDKGVPVGLPDKGEIGSLVNEPAFRQIGKIAASDHADLNTENTMSQLILASLNISPSAADAESAAVAAIKAMQEKIKGIPALDTEITTLKASNKELTDKIEASETKRHEDLVTAAIAAGKIAPKDDETKQQALDLLKASEALGEKFLESLPAKFAGLDVPITRKGSDRQVSAESRVEAAQAKARAELGANAPFSQVWARAAEIDPPAFEA